MKITILTDNSKSWFVPYGQKLREELLKLGHHVSYVYEHKAVTSGDICFILSCTKLMQEEILKLNVNNIVVHASDLPMGKGFSPLQWQILNGKDQICLTLFEVVAEVDAGPYYLKSFINFEGTELYDELRDKLAVKIVSMCKDYAINRSNLKPINQQGVGSFYPRRTKLDDKLNIDKSIKEQFNHLRIADNENYPLWFENNGKKYIVKIYSGE